MLKVVLLELVLQLSVKFVQVFALDGAVTARAIHGRAIVLSARLTCLGSMFKADREHPELMRLASLYSGGKDSTFATYIMEQQGHEVEHLVNIRPKDPHSWVFHTPNLNVLPLLAEAMGKKLVAVDSSGEEADDLRALRDALSILDVEGVITGAIASDYQWDRINHVCEGLGLPVYSPLWRKDQALLMGEMIEAGVRAIMVSVSADGMDSSWLGREIDRETLKELMRLSKQNGMNLAGEGGEYESLTIDSPLQLQTLSIVEKEIMTTRDGGSLKVIRAALEEKP
jgi:ABC transporter with metal-binding/Fe-S-binding domain ATP-binding protein